MSKLAVKLFEEREEKKENYLPLLNAVFGKNEYNPALNENSEFAAEVQEEFAVVFVVDLFQTAEEHLIKDGGGLVLSDPAHEEDAVVKEEVAPFEGFFIPHDGQSQSSFAEVI